MPRVTISDKGQITLPAVLRRRLGWSAGRQLDVEVISGELRLRAMKTIADLDGSLAEYARGTSIPWEEQRRIAEEALARQVADE